MTAALTKPAALPAATLKREDIANLTGLEVMQAMMNGKLPPPPIAETANFTLADVQDGRVVFEGMPSDRFLNPLGTVHGGWIATLIDSAMGCATHTKLKVGQAYTTIEMKLNFTRAVMPHTGLIRCEGYVVHAGSRIVTTEARMTDAAGKILAHGSETCLIMDAK
ncbi:MAG: PaaI family thioesterase [Micavibrio sp.]|nr:PaaI family thioesterase [Micavibrio sp.]